MGVMKKFIKNKASELIDAAVEVQVKLDEADKKLSRSRCENDRKESFEKRRQEFEGFFNEVDESLESIKSKFKDTRQ
jgi:ribulose kinase